MRTKPQYGLRQGPTRAAQTFRCMPARRSRPKPAKAAEAKAHLAAQGFRVADSGQHTSKTLMLQELEALLAAVPADAPARAYRAAIVEENVLGTLKTCEGTAAQSSQENALKGYRQGLTRER